MSMSINYNGEIKTITKTTKKTYIDSRNSFDGKGKYHFIWKSEDGKRFVKFWSEQVAEIEEVHVCDIMVKAYDIVK